MGTCPSSQGNCDMTFDITVLREGASFQMAVEIRRLRRHAVGQRSCFLSAFNIRTIATIVFQFRVVAGTPNILSIRPR